MLPHVTIVTTINHTYYINNNTLIIITVVIKVTQLSFMLIFTLQEDLKNCNVRLLKNLLNLYPTDYFNYVDFPMIAYTRDLIKP